MSKTIYSGGTRFEAGPSYTSF